MIHVAGIAEIVLWTVDKARALDFYFWWRHRDAGAGQPQGRGIGGTIPEQRGAIAAAEQQRPAVGAPAQQYQTSTVDRTLPAE